VNVVEGGAGLLGHRSAALVEADVIQAVPFEEHKTGLEVDLLNDAVDHDAVPRTPDLGEVAPHERVDDEQRRALWRQQELVEIGPVPVACRDPLDLAVGLVEHHALAEPDADVRDALPPGEHGPAPVALDPEVHRLLAPRRRAGPHELPAAVDDHGSVLSRPALWRQEDVLRRGPARAGRQRDVRGLEIRSRPEPLDAAARAVLHPGLGLRCATRDGEAQVSGPRAGDREVGAHGDLLTRLERLIGNEAGAPVVGVRS
jgi:hypothetical protein